VDPVLSICIPTFERAAYLERCLASLAPIAELPFPVEVVVSDNASTDETVEVVEAAPVPVRLLRQDRNVGAERNVVSALRAARGRYAVYLGDDDRLLLDRVAAIVAMFEENPSLVCVQAPWISRDDATGRDLGLFWRIASPAVLGAEEAWACWKLLLREGIFPEVAVYRTEALHRVLHLPRTLHWAFVWTFRLLAQGRVAFMPVPFYVHVVRPASDLPPRAQVGMDQATTHLDRYRGGLEWALCAALRHSAGYVPEDKRHEAARMLERFQADRARVAARVAAGKGDYIGASEQFARSMAFEAAVELPGIQAFERDHAMLAALQAVVETADGAAGVRRLVLCGLPNEAVVERLVREVLGFQGGVERAEPGAAARFEDAVVLVEAPAQRAPLLEAGVLPGRVLAWTEVVDAVRVHNPLGAALATRRAG
jgi:glycosyltransferase involved in cell wall biosynthesis